MLANVLYDLEGRLFYSNKNYGAIWDNLERVNRAYTDASYFVPAFTAIGSVVYPATDPEDLFIPMFLWERDANRRLSIEVVHNAFVKTCKESV